MVIDEIREELFKLQDPGYQEFQSRSVPSVDPARIIGVRVPELRKLAKTIAQRDDVSVFLADLPHKYYDEDMLHAYVISSVKGAGHCLELMDAFLPYVDNWATSDSLSPKCLRKNKQLLLSYVDKWIESDLTYTKRVAIDMLMTFFLDDDFDKAYLSKVSKIRSDEYYVNMMIAWYFATALAKQYEATVPYIEKCRLDRWTHNKTIQKAIESYRITPEQKEYLKTLRRKA